MSKEKVNSCKSCKHWKPEQAELGYSRFEGFCTCFQWKYSFEGNADVKIFDRGNIHPTHHDGTHRYENQNHQIPCGKVEKSRYCFVTDEKFGCIHHTTK